MPLNELTKRKLQPVSQFLSRQKSKLQNSLLGAKAPVTQQQPAPEPFKPSYEPAPEPMAESRSERPEPPRAAVAEPLEDSQTLTQLAQFVGSLTGHFEPLSPSTSLIMPAESTGTPQYRIAMVVWSYDLCLSLGLSIPCHEFQMQFYDFLQARHPQYGNFSTLQVMLAAALIVSCRELAWPAPVRRRIAEQLNLDTAALAELTAFIEEIDFYILPKFQSDRQLAWYPVSAQLAKLEAYFQPSERLMLCFLNILRCTVPLVFRARNRVQVLCCLGVAELVACSRLRFSWALLLRLGQQGILNDHETARIRTGIRELYAALLGLDWTSEAKWPRSWFARVSVEPEPRALLLPVLCQLPPLCERSLHNEPGTIWLLAPSTLM